jgi:hypothetical protein
LASNSIAERYWRIRAIPTYLQGTPNGHSAIRSERPTPTATLKEIEMKQLLIVLTLVVASAAPAMADSFPNLYQTNR